jgi:O-acetyl-ADP-ribose deacetylase (regulator of RNase III)
MPLNSGIEKHIGNLLSVKRGIIVHGCNAQGAMGAGVARAVRSQYPLAYQVYREEYEKNGLKVGDITSAVVARCEGGTPALIIVNAVTQENFGTDRVQVDYSALSLCFDKVAALARQTLLEVHFPLIGCGLAGGAWEEVAPRIESALGTIPAHLWVFA